MKTKQLILVILALSGLDQAVKLIVHIRFMDAFTEIIPGFLTFEPVFNDKHSYINALLYSHFNLNLGKFFHVILFLAIAVIMIYLYRYLLHRINRNKKLLAVAASFELAGLLCALTDNIIWRKGTLDFIRLKDYFTFDLKDVYINLFIGLFAIYVLLNIRDIRKIKFTDVIRKT